MIDKIRKSKKLRMMCYILIALVWGTLVFFPIRYLNSLIVEEITSNTIIDTKLLNNRAEDKTLKVQDFIKEKNLEDYENFIQDKLYSNIPDSIVDDILTNRLEPIYQFNKGSLVLTYNIDNIYGYGKPQKIEIAYNEIATLIKFKYEESSLYLQNNELDNDKISIALSFDDGPNGENTKTLINLLEDYNMSATFFMIGNKLSEDKEAVLKVYNSQSEIGYHSFNHNYFTKQKASKIKEEYNNSNSILYGIIGDYFKLTRPPYGSYNKDAINAIDTPFVNWNVDTNDWKYRDSEILINYVLNNYHDGDIILCHDSYKSTVDGMKTILKELYLRDVQVMSISKLAQLNDKKLENHKIYFNLK